jgi:tetratricopeptide (TPR) repeat protein
MELAARACLPYLAVALPYAVLRLYAVGGVAPLRRPGITTWDAVLNAPALLLAYLGKMVWPARLSAYNVLDPVASAAEPAFLLGLAAVALLAIGGFHLARRDGRLGFAAALAVVPLLPVLYLPAVGESAFAERYTYLPLAGFCWLVAAALAAAAERLAGRRARTAALAAVVLLALPAAARAAARSRVWFDDERLASVTLAQEPRSRAMWCLLASARAKEPAEVLATYEQALRHFPGDPQFRSEIIELERTMSRISAEEAIRRLEAVVAQEPEKYDIHVFLGRAYARKGDHAGAERAYRRAIELNPSLKVAYDGLALALIAQGRTDVEESGLRQGAGFTLGGELDLLIAGAAQERAGRLDEAERTFREVLRTFPDSTLALFSLAVVAARRSDHDTAIELCRRAIAARPDMVDAYQQLSMSAMALGRHGEAIEALEAAVALSPQDKAIHNRLGVAYARAGRPADARRAWTAALAIDPAFEGARHNLERLGAAP